MVLCDGSAWMPGRFVFSYLLQTFPYDVCFAFRVSKKVLQGARSAAANHHPMWPQSSRIDV